MNPDLNQGIRIITIEHDVDSNLIVNRMVFKDINGIGYDFLAGRQGANYIGIDVQAQHSKGGENHDQYGNNGKETIIDHTAFTTT
jgi:hypothetical protein